MIRRIHLYFGLFLAPWVLMYALSTAAMNHRLTSKPQFVRELEQPYMREFPDGSTAAEMARTILSDLRLEGAHTANLASGRLTITRQDPVTPRRMVYTAAERKLVVEKQVFSTPAFLERMHRRRGYQHPYAVDDAWAFTVDLSVAAIVFWSLSGLWLWWEMKRTRWWGAACLLSGFVAFALFLATI